MNLVAVASANRRLFGPEGRKMLPCGLGRLIYYILSNNCAVYYILLLFYIVNHLCTMHILGHIRIYGVYTFLCIYIDIYKYIYIYIQYIYKLYIYLCISVYHIISAPLVFKIHHTPGGQARLRPYFP